MKDNDNQQIYDDPDFVQLNSLEAEDMGSAVLTLEEALQTFEVESGLFRLKLKKDRNDSFQEDDRMIKIRKQAVNMEGEERYIIVISDVTKVISFEQVIEKQKQEKYSKQQAIL